ncbi:hypothetical protein [Aromatoleum bremense]|uniref:Uncharacterized protein n=1 Tax=Aromatoleum bremense TaxID=76115 RepID=A0ABX1NXD2_9RHOO|nr:hypothetical protein [Aromatoleum bremense]NMG16680.1 hypothetical protein [Aromatoleum bremense]QTQ33830.1 Uncharacterized protein pbN1_38450 [Aromatoleum bremense]
MPPALGDTLADTPAESLSAALRERVEALRDGHPLRAAGGVIAARRLIPRFYEARGFRPAWDHPERRLAPPRFPPRPARMRDAGLRL